MGRFDFFYQSAKVKMGGGGERNVQRSEVRI